MSGPGWAHPKQHDRTEGLCGESIRDYDDVGVGKPGQHLSDGQTLKMS